jgi:hypothetical protein
MPEEEAAACLGLPPAAAATLWPALTASPRALARLSHFFASSGPAWLPAFLAADFSALPARLLLLPREALLVLGRYTGVALHCRESAALLRREDVLAFRAAFGPAARDFAVQRAPFFLREPERLARALAGGPKEGQDDVAGLISRINRAGRAALAVCAGTLPPPLAGLFSARLPRPEDPEAAAPPNLDEAAWYSLKALMKKLLAKEAELKPWAGFS